MLRAEYLFKGEGEKMFSGHRYHELLSWSREICPETPEAGFLNILGHLQQVFVLFFCTKAQL